ncbi:Lon protease family protein [Solemya velum gill symbiont]|uniref:Lon protease family protein n=1 Tax=Solemya velum gill symbiont TaxID=2340 RepID=UPI000996ADDC|nr:ATP-binding protein [Solemya velum gill symbiont]OOY98790.1 ATP-dependent protease [Solemya velum gill symbiont]OOZ01078.1 ATP-dependent protease [Solemya velum gill symbiont]OOZ03254.1 ATP-dependent protease [Solemya velum gill symbiont]OOZ05512.1 ATP-dependent protease [Solemya velum gill symbiont]OOZ07750.1 ATP-dependent protease [Solemya velum gill symbiont]
MHSVTPLLPGDLNQSCDPGSLPFKTTDELEDLGCMLGQERAVEAIELGTGHDLQGFNLFVLGPAGTGRHSFIRQFLQEKASKESVSTDWCYVNNFDEPRKPKAIELPAGRGRRFRDDMTQLVKEASSALPTAFESEDYHNRRQEIEQQANQAQEKAFQEVKEQAEELDLGIIQTATGFTFVPLHDGVAITPEEYNKLSEKEQERLQQDTEKVGEELRKTLQKIPQRVRKAREKVQKLNREVALFAVSSLIDELLSEYEEFPRVISYLKALQQDIADHAEIILQASSGEEEGANSIIADPDEIDPQSAILRRYSVNLLVDRNDSDGAPVIFEDHPAYPFLVGQIEHESQYGNLVTDFTLIRPGALHRANGGYLVIDVRKILIEPLAWEALKRALKSREIDTKSIAQAYSLIGTVSLEPEPIPLDVKVVLIGDREYYYLLMEYDPEFLEHFKVAADFEDDMERSDENMLQLARLVASIVRKEELKPLDNSAVARVIEESSRNAGDAQMLSTRMRRIADIVREAHYWATRNDNSVIGTDEVRSAIRMQQRRMSRIRDRLLRETLRNTILIDSEGEMPGQVNGLATIQLGNFIFGHPVRITANSSLGAGKVIDIEREVELGGPIHSKGVLILSSFLASRYVTDRPLSLSASLVFEQSYGPIEGDSASAAELCALLSSLAQAPIKQSIAITGSVNQHGQIQPIGGANQKIEGFYDLCKARGLTGGQGVIIPASNVKHLMLKQSVVDAVANGQFNIYAVSSIDECMTILTGLEAGERNHKGEFPEQSLNQRVVMRLKEFADRQKKSSG